MSNIRNMEYHRIDQLITVLYNYFESGSMDQMLCKEIYFYLKLPFCSAEQNQLGKLVSGDYKIQDNS